MAIRGSATLLASALLTLSAPVFAQPVAPPGPYNGEKVVRLTTHSFDELQKVYDNSTDVWSCHIGVGPIDVQVTPKQLDALTKAGFDPKILIDDVQARLDAERAQITAAHARPQSDITWFNTYRTYAEINTKLDALAAANPTMATTFTIGNSLQGNAIRGIRFSAPDLPGNPRSSRPSMLINGCQHAREWISPMTCMYMADQMLEKFATDPRTQNILNHMEIIVIPVVNADGYLFTWTSGNRLWRKNRRPNGDGTFGVDLNRNWGYQWGGEGASTSTNNETYRGPSAFSEPETQRLRDFMSSEPRLRGSMDFHSYDELILSPWGYTENLPPAANTFADLDHQMQSSIASVHGLTYAAGPTYNTIYPAAGVITDWSYGALNVLGMSVELRDTGTNGFVLPADQIVPTGEENFAGIYTMLEYMLALPLRIEQAAPIPTVVDASTGATVTLSVMNATSSLAGLPRLYSRVGAGNPFTAASMTPSGNLFQGQLPGTSCPGQVDYYFEADTTDGQTLRFPADAPTSRQVAIGPGAPLVLFSDDMETDKGWTVGAPGDTATTGLWERGVPQQTAAQPGQDHSPDGTKCWMTGLAAGSGVGDFDVDGGATTLTSPRMNALPPSYLHVSETRISYARWYSNNQGSNPNSDSMTIRLSNDDGATWTTIDAPSDNVNAWVVTSFRLQGLIAPTDRMRIRFIASDLGGGSVVEAGVDDVQIIATVCAPDLDLNGDGNADQGDVDYLVNVIGGGANPNGIDPDFNQDGNVDQADVDAFISALAGG